VPSLTLTPAVQAHHMLLSVDPVMILVAQVRAPAAA